VAALLFAVACAFALWACKQVWCFRPLFCFVRSSWTPSPVCSGTPFFCFSEHMNYICKDL
jgi:hypothetical protein